MASWTVLLMESHTPAAPSTCQTIATETTVTTANAIDSRNAVFMTDQGSTRVSRSRARRGPRDAGVGRGVSDVVVTVGAEGVGAPTGGGGRSGMGGGGRLPSFGFSALSVESDWSDLLTGAPEGTGTVVGCLVRSDINPHSPPGFSSSPLSPVSADSSGSILTSGSATSDSSVSPSSVGAVPTASSSSTLDSTDRATTATASPALGVTNFTPWVDRPTDGLKLSSMGLRTTWPPWVMDRISSPSSTMNAPTNPPRSSLVSLMVVMPRPP